MNIDVLDSEVYCCIAKNMGYEPDDEAGSNAIAKLTPEEAFQKWCRWNGFLGDWSRIIAKAYQNIMEAELCTTALYAAGLADVPSCKAKASATTNAMNGNPTLTCCLTVIGTACLFPV